MTTRQERASFDDLLEATGSLLDQVKVLVSAVDDLRCEVEWQAKNIAAAELPERATASVAPPLAYGTTVQEEILPPLTGNQVADNSLLTASGRLRACERSYCQGLRGRWSDEWAEHDDFEMPVGRVVSVDADTWSSVLDIRPAHVIDEGCCCEEGEGAPFLLAWQCRDEFLLRELTDEEARRLQQLCLACQVEQADQSAQRVSSTPAETQRDLF